MFVLGYIWLENLIKSFGMQHSADEKVTKCHFGGEVVAQSYQATIDNLIVFFGM